MINSGGGMALPMWKSVTSRVPKEASSETVACGVEEDVDDRYQLPRGCDSSRLQLGFGVNKKDKNDLGEIIPLQCLFLEAQNLFVR
jgi:hypothetical protein